MATADQKAMSVLKHTRLFYRQAVFQIKKTSCAIFCPSEQLTIQNYLTKLLNNCKEWGLSSDHGYLKMTAVFFLYQKSQSFICHLRIKRHSAMLVGSIPGPYMKRISVSLERLFFSFS